MDKITDILFDFDETLSPGPIESYIPADKLKERFNVTDDQIHRLQELDFELLKKFYLPEVSQHIKTREQETELHRKVYSIMAEGIRFTEKEKFVEFMINYRMNKLEFALYPEVLEILKNLKSKYKLHIFTNALPSRAREVQNTKIGSFFQNIFISNTLGFYKPQLSFYKYALEKIDALPEKVLLIDDKEKFLITAKETGMETILIDRKSRYLQSKFRKIQNLSELPI